ncbi:MAG TPA: serine hydrolase domain-containing protein [Dongiaceae bacterium]|nr:serine hydrolase domain-containing protein [Dongiaceae bacterium]
MTDEGRLERAVERVLGRVPGVALAVVGPAGVRISRAAGFADLARRTAASPAMVCPWFSMTKIVTATVAMRAAEQGALDLDAPVHPWVPAMRHLTPVENARRITPRHLLAHTAGLVNPLPLAWIHPAAEPGPDPARFLDGLLARHGRLQGAPGGRSRYSNLGTLVLGEALAAVHRMPYVDLVRHAVLEPLALSHTDFVYRPDMLEHAAVGYHARFDPMRLLLPRWVQGPATGRWMSLRRCLLDGSAYGGLVGSLDDVARFLRLHLNDGELDGVRLVSSQGAATMRVIASPGDRFDLGLGWFRPANRRGVAPAFVEHLGGGAGFYNVMRLYPDRGIGIAIMGNATSYDLDALADLAPEIGS